MLCVAGVVGFGGERIKWVFRKGVQTFSMFPGDVTDTEEIGDDVDEREGVSLGLVDDGRVPIVVKGFKPSDREFWEDCVVTSHEK